MTGPASIDQDNFRSMLARNITLPLGRGALSAAIFVGLIFFLLSSLNWVEHTERVIGNANDVARMSSDMETGRRGYLITGNESFLQPYEIARARSAGEIKALAELVSDNPPQVDRMRRVGALQAQWTDYARDMIELRRNNKDYQEAVRSGRGKGLTDEIRRELQSFSAVEQRLLKERNDEARSTTLWSVTAYLLFTLIISAMLALFGRRELLRLSGIYSTALAQQSADAKVLEQQAWLRDGQTQLGAQIIGQKALPLLGRSVLEFMARYLDVAVAGFYVREDDGKLQREAAYGFSQVSEEARQSFYRAEGLVGQAAAENRVLQIDDLPDGYLKVTSGLGEGAPRHVLVVPLHNEGLVTGVLELGFMRELQARDVAFVKLIANNIGSSIQSAVARQRLQGALVETQQLNEELQVQQEELRSANEELGEQSRVLTESQANLENEQAELAQTNVQLAQQAVSLDQKNAALHDTQVQLEEHALELGRASRYKSEVLANMSHELRTPLNSSLILSKLLSDNPKGNLDDEQVRFAQSIYSAGNDLLNLINNILDISKVEFGKLELSPENIAPAKLLASLQATFKPIAAQKKLVFEMQVKAGAPVTLSSDRQRVAQILKNLLSNAIKFTDTGVVNLTVSGAADGFLAFAVRDSGIGIREDQQKIIFEAFRQADGTTSRRYGGTGLGLSISRDLAALLGGSITVESMEGKGSTFTLLLPAQRTSPTAAIVPADIKPAVPRPAPYLPAPVTASAAVETIATIATIANFSNDRNLQTPGKLALVIEDDLAFAHILYDLAHELNYHCLVAHSADEGFALAAQFTPAAILLDMGLPDRSGLPVLQRLKETPQTRHIPVHVVSAHDRSQTALKMGAIGYAIKPTTREQLVKIFNRLEEKLAQKVKRVLLVEDDDRQRESVTQLIGGQDVEITAVATGKEALALLAAHIYDCMIIDLKLPDIQGNELLRGMASTELCSFPPVIVYTGRNLTREEEADLLQYSRSIIIKGVRSPERLLDEVTLFLHKVESEMSVERQNMLRTARSRDRLLEGRKILLVDDDDVRNIFALSSALEQKGIRMVIGRNGFEAIQKLDEISDIDLVLIDVMMPGMDGLEATRRIHQDPSFQKLPVIAVTAKAMKDDQEQCLSAGANDYLAKPVDLDRLFHCCLCGCRTWSGFSMAHRTRAAAADMQAAAHNTEIELRLLMEAIYLKYNYDFRDYSGPSQKRRVLHALTQFDCPTISELQSRVLHDPTMFLRLLQYLTIPVSEMFRDPSFFLALRQQVMPRLGTYPFIKIWIAGCSTGEEVYSLAILLKEEGLLARSLIYATDINPQSMDKARQGIFPLAAVKGYTANYQKAGGTCALSDYYTAAYDAVILDKSLRDSITFADHSLATDSVFSETQLVLCRNVLIYFNKKLPDRALGLFYDSLSHRGFFGLGSKETIDFSAHAHRFDALDKPERIFRKRWLVATP